MGGKWRSLNAREVAPIDATDDMFVEYPLNSTLGQFIQLITYMR